MGRVRVPPSAPESMSEEQATLWLDGSVDRRWRVGDPTLEGEGDPQKRHRGHGKGEKEKGHCEEQ